MHCKSTQVLYECAYCLQVAFIMITSGNYPQWITLGLCCETLRSQKCIFLCLFLPLWVYLLDINWWFSVFVHIFLYQFHHQTVNLTTAAGFTQTFWCITMTTEMQRFLHLDLCGIEIFAFQMRATIITEGIDTDRIKTKITLYCFTFEWMFRQEASIWSDLFLKITRNYSSLFLSSSHAEINLNQASSCLVLSKTLLDKS